MKRPARMGRLLKDPEPGPNRTTVPGWPKVPVLAGGLVVTSGGTLPPLIHQRRNPANEPNATVGKKPAGANGPGGRRRWRCAVGRAGSGQRHVGFRREVVLHGSFEVIGPLNGGPAGPWTGPCGGL